MSCSTVKSIVKPSDFKEEPAEKILESLYNHYGDYESYKSKFSVNIVTTSKSAENEESNKKLSFNGNLRIQKDSIIWVSIAPLMVEIIRCKLTPDSVFFVNKINKTYYAGDYSIVSSMIGLELNYKTLQSIFLNELCMYPFSQEIDTVAEIEKYSVKNKNNDIQLINKMSKKSIKEGVEYVFNQSYLISSSYLRILGMQIQELDKGNLAAIDYKEFKEIDSVIFPENIHFIVKSKNEKMKLNLEYSKQEFNNNQNYPFNISSRYSEWKKN